MKQVITIYICLIFVLLAQGCRETEKPQYVQMKDANDLKLSWDELIAQLGTNPDLWTEVENILKRDVPDYFYKVQKNALQQFYLMLKDPSANPSGACAGLEVFVRLDAKEVIRESLLNPRKNVVGWGLVIVAAKATKNTNDEKALPHLIYVLSQNNYPQEGSEEATIHQIMKRELVEAIQQITHLDIKVSEIDADSTEEVERVLSMARAWRGKEAEKPQYVQMRDVNDFKLPWDKLTAKLGTNPDLWTEVENILKRDAPDYCFKLQKNSLQQLYLMLKDPSAKASGASAGLKVFVRLDAKEVIRESLLNPRKNVVGWGLVMVAAEAIKNTSDEKALPHLIYVLSQNNYVQEGSEEATVHRRMKTELIEAIQQITGLDIKVSEINVNNTEEVERVLSMARAWAKQKGIELL